MSWQIVKMIKNNVIKLIAKHEKIVLFIIPFLLLCLFLMIYQQKPSLTEIVSSNPDEYKIGCGSKEKYGKRTLRVTGKSIETLSTGGTRVKNCTTYQNMTYKQLVISYRKKNSIIYGVVIDGQEIMSPIETIKSGKNSFIILYLFFTALLCLANYQVIKKITSKR